MTTVLGRNVTGEVTRFKVGRYEQWPGEKFLEYLDAVLNVNGVESVRWTQYTPYFNDGEPCVFNVHEPTIKLIDGDPEAGDYGDGYVDTYGMKDYESGNYRDSSIKPEYQDVHPAFTKLSENMAHFEDFLEESFGDHANITATKEGFDVEFYDHD